MKLFKHPNSVTITFSPKDYFLKKIEDDLVEELDADYCLVHRIDMSYKGKPDQVGLEVLYLNEEEAKTFEDSGFEQIF